MKDVLVLVFSNLKHDARVMRQINWLKKEYRVTVVCFDADPDPAVNFIKISQTKLTMLRKGFLAISLLFRSYKIAYTLFHDYGSLADLFSDKHWHFIMANDIDALPLAFQLKKKAKIIFDAHEYAPRHFENNRIWKTFFQPFYIHLCKKYIPQVDGMLTVGKGLAQEYKRNFGVEPLIITNAAKYHDITSSSVLPNKIRLIHHGIANQSRRLELMIDLMSYLDDRFTLDLILLTSDYASPQTKAYIEGLKQRAAQNRRIQILPAVKSDLVVKTINHYDMGVFIIPPVNFNYANTLPNKLFDFIQARLGIAIGPTPEMAEIVNHYNLGVVAENFEPRTLADKLNQLTEADIHRFKANATLAARDLNAEKNEQLFNALLRSL